MKKKKQGITIVGQQGLRFGFLDMGGGYDLPDPTEKETSNVDYVSWGADNKFPQRILQMCKDSAVLGSIINGTSNYAMGDAVVTSERITAFSTKVNADYETIQDVIKKLVYSYLRFGGFAIDIIRNQLGEITEIYACDMSKYRRGKGKDVLYYSEEWGARKAEAKEVPMYDRSKQQKHSVYYFKGHRSEGVYPVPLYCGALPAIQTSIEIAKFHLNSILNNFTPSAIIAFNDGKPTDDVAEENERKIYEKFSGASNAARLLTVYSDSKDSAPEITRLESDNFDQKYAALRDSTMQEIFIAFGATPNLFGLPTATTGFSKQEFVEAFTLYQHNMLSELQADVERAFSVIFGEPGAVRFVPLNLYKETQQTEE